MSYKRQRQENKTKTPIINGIIRENVNKNHAVLNTGFWQEYPITVAPRIFLGSSAAHKQFKSYN